ncbi:MAG: GPI anchored serine-threonine rich family protein, partial [Azonexus sp.]|nr:GPI anchored serine-threonine rich family protein [Azonexus sp.]
LPNDVIDPNLAEKARERGLSEHEVRGMAHQPTSHLALQAALAANGKSSAVIADITTVDLTQFEAVCAVLGIFPNNHVVPANSAEALALVNYITGGGKVYLEGGDVWYWDPGFAGGHDFGPLFGITGLSDGTNDLATVQGVTGTFTAGLNFTYSGQNNYIDRLSPDAPAFTIHRNSSPVYDCGVAKSAADYRTIGTSYEFGGLADGASTKEELMAAYLDFLDLPTGPVDAVIWIPQEVLEPNLAEKAAQRGFTLPQVETLKVRITSHEALAAALEGNGKTVNVVNELTEASLAEAQYLFVVLGIYPNNHVIQNGDPEVPVIQNFMAAGGKVYMEGGDVWYYDPLQLNGFNFGPFFGITAEADGVNDLKTVYGSCAVEELDFVYEGTNNFIDHIAASAQACLFHSNFAPIYGCGVGHDPGTGARTIGNSFQFGGMADNSLSAATKTQLMQQYLQFFDTGLPACNLSVISPNGGESLTFGSVFEIQWTSANTSGLVKLELSTDGGASYSLIAGAETDDGSYHWTVPNVLSSNCLVRISDHADPGCVDVSDNPFSLVPSTEWLV